MCERTYRELRDGIIYDVEGVGGKEVQGDLADERDGVDHAGLDDDEQDLPVAEVRHRATVLAEHVPALHSAMVRCHTNYAD